MPKIMILDDPLSGVDEESRRTIADVSAVGDPANGLAVSFEADLDFAVFDTPFHALLIRAPWVEKVGAGVEVLARIASGTDAGRIVAVRQGPVLATSFHPEISGDDRLHRHFVRLVRAEQHSAEQS